MLVSYFAVLDELEGKKYKSKKLQKTIKASLYKFPL